MKREILFASRKGSTGKSTLCAVVANHLASNGMKVAVVDCDSCSTLSWVRKGDLKILPGGERPPYPIFRDEDYFDKKDRFEDYDYVLIDNYDMVSENGTGIVVVPFTYTEMVLDTTFRFVRNLKTTGGCKVAFVPNEVNGYKQSIKKKDVVDTINWILGIFGRILPKVPNSRQMAQVNTISNAVETNVLVKDFINALVPECQMTEEELTICEGGQQGCPSNDDSDSEEMCSYSEEKASNC